MQLNIKNIHWENYETPYRESLYEVPKQLEYIFTSTDSIDEIEAFLYTDLLENIKHQYKVYNIIDPIIEVFDSFIRNQDCKIKNELLFFLDFVFKEFIREENTILTTPVEYSVSAMKLVETHKNEYLYYKKFQKLYFDNFSQGEGNLDRKIELYYDSLFENEKIGQKINAVLSDKYNHDLSLSALISLGFLKYKTPHLELQNVPEMDFISSNMIDIGLAINSLPYDEAHLRSLIRSEEEINVLWGAGAVSVLSGCAYTMDCMRRDTASKKRALYYILESFEYLKSIYISQYDIDFPHYKAMIEDVTSLIFNDLFNKQRIIQYKELRNIQKYFYDLLAKEFKIHTYSMLRAGLLPLNMDKNQTEEIYDIYNCYDL